MISKRFKVTDNRSNPYLNDWNVTDYADGGIVHHPMTSENMANVMCNLLNKLHEEKEQLEKETKELKQFKQLVFDLIDREINEMEKKYKFGQEVYKGCPMHNIRYGINTLKELRKELSEND